MQERQMREAITEGSIETVTFFGTPAGWELWAAPAPRGTGERLESALGKVRTFKSLDNGVKLARALGWRSQIHIDQEEGRS